MTVTREQVLAELSRVIDPGTGRDLVAADLVRGLTVNDGRVRFVLDAPDAAAGARLDPVLKGAIASSIRMSEPTRE